MRNLLRWYAFLAYLGLAVCSTGVYFSYGAYRLRRDYPDLEDHSPNVDWYWPSVAHSMDNVLGTVATLTGAFMLLIAAIAFLSSQKEDKAIKR